jgi:HlyD family secretion protein
MAADAAVELVFFPDERNLAWLQLGQPARAAADAYPQQVFDATVSVHRAGGGSGPRQRRGPPRVPTPPPVPQAGHDGVHRPDVARKAGALVVPSEACAASPRRRPGCVVEGGRVARRAVQVGCAARAASRSSAG